ncbi:conserved Plasmodium protein, unknown function [Plasmodium relictum]|uniref:Kelch domain-containing protein n=1 Tax=Plasmodium relictum TaxID=85471 RepID=A0A1J1GKN4_PLARL|nr:conserved Plasmodium protein, unknown function [Plasmodium relictum]CRG85406.1 conserved Plasmodium protein, unknown function [Plasmodium relictum]
MSLTLICNDNWNKNENINKPTGRVGHSLHFYYELNSYDINEEEYDDIDNSNGLKKDKESESEKKSEDTDEKEFENDFDKNIKNEDTPKNNKNNFKNNRNKYIHGKYKIIIFGGGSIEDDFIKNYTNEYLMNRGCIYYEKENNYINYKSMSIENYLNKTYNDIYICEEKNFNSWENIHTYNVPPPRAFHASCIVNLGLNGVFLFIHGGKVNNNLLADDSLYALNLSHISFDDKGEKQIKQRKDTNSNCESSGDDNNYDEEDEYEDNGEINNGYNEEELNINNETNKKCYNSEYDKYYIYNNLKEENKISSLYKKVIKKDFKNLKKKTIKKDDDNLREDIAKDSPEKIIQKGGNDLTKKFANSIELNNQNFSLCESEKGFFNNEYEKREKEIKKKEESEKYNISQNNLINKKKLRYSSSSDSSSYLCSTSDTLSSSYSTSSSCSSCLSNSSFLHNKSVSDNYSNTCKNLCNPTKSALSSSSSDGIYGVTNTYISEEIKRKWIQIKIIGNKPNSRYGHTLDFLYPYLILFGGNEKICDVENLHCKNDLWVLNIEKCKKKKKKKKEFIYFTWEEIEYTSINPLGRYFHSTCIWYDKKKKKNNLILYGGKMRSKTNTSRLFLLQKNGNSWIWSLLPVYVDCLNENRAYHSIVNINDYIFIIGGEEYNYKYIEKMPSALYSFETKKFHYIDDFTAKACLKCFAKDYVIYSWGGFTDIPFKQNFFPNNFAILDVSPHILSSQMRDSLYDEYDENSNFIIKAESDSDDNIYKNMNKEISKLEKKQKELEKDLSFHIKLNNNLNYRLKSQTLQYQKLIQLINFKQKQNAYLFDLLKKNNLDINNVNNNKDYDSIISSISNNNYTNCSDYFKFYNNINDNLMNTTKADIDTHNLDSRHEDNNIINELNNQIQDKKLINEINPRDSNTYENMLNIEKIQRYSYTNNTNTKNENNEEHMSSQSPFEQNYSKNTFDNKCNENKYIEQIKNDLINVQEVSEFLEKTQNDYFNEEYNVYKNNLYTNEDIKENSKYLDDHLNYKSSSADSFINNNSSFMNDYSISLDLCIGKQQNDYNNNLTDNSSIPNQNLGCNEKKNTKYNENENIRNQADIKLPEREASNQRVRRKTAEKCLKLIEQDRLNRILKEK